MQDRNLSVWFDLIMLQARAAIGFDNYAEKNTDRNASHWNELQSNLSATATLGTEKSGHCRDVAIMGR